MTIELTDEEWATVRHALAIGSISFEGDSWYAAGEDGPYDYDEADRIWIRTREIMREHPGA